MKSQQALVLLSLLILSVSSMYQSTLKMIDISINEEFLPLTDSTSSDDQVAEQIKALVMRKYEVQLSENQLQNVLEEFLFKSIFDLVCQTPVSKEWARLFGYKDKIPLTGEISQIQTDEAMNEKAVELAVNYFKDGLPSNTNKVEENFRPYVSTFFAAFQDKNEEFLDQYATRFYTKATEYIYTDLSVKNYEEYVDNIRDTFILRYSSIRKRLSDLKAVRIDSYHHLSYAALSIVGHASYDPEYLTEGNFEKMKNRVSLLIRLAVRSISQSKIPESMKRKRMVPSVKQFEENFKNDWIENEKSGNDKMNRPADHPVRKLANVLEETLRNSVEKFNRII